MALEGGEQLVINTQERAVSTDVNRLQAFRTRDMAESFRNLYGIGQGTDDLDAGALYQPVTSTTAPLTAEILSGLLVQPQVGTLNVLVSAGLAYVVTPQSTTDNSVWEFVNDPGISIVGSFVMTANPGGSPRIDVIECQPADMVLETDSRDIFNPTTGLFTASTVTKAEGAQMVYRVRTGTVGGGFPGVASGWLPLAVASVAAGATLNDQITFWDVRPLQNDRSAGPVVKPRRVNGVVNGATNTAVSGIVDYVEPTMGRRLGGQLRTGAPIADAATVDITNAANQDPTVAGIVSGGPVFVWLVTPFGLPRWARYTDYTTGSRQPRSPRGILVVSGNGPRSDGIIASAAPPQLPTSLGLGSTVLTAGVCVAAGFLTSGALKLASEGGDGASYLNFAPTRTFTPSGTTATVALGGDFPADATELYVYVDANITPASSAGSYRKWQALAPFNNSGNQPAILAQGEFISATSTQYILPLTELDQGATITAFTVYASSSGVASTSSFSIWKVSNTTGVRTLTQIGTTTPGPTGPGTSVPFSVAASEVIDHTAWSYYAEITGDASIGITWSAVLATGTAPPAGAEGTCILSFNSGANQGYGGYIGTAPVAQDVQFTTWVSLVPVVPAGALPSTTLELLNTSGATINSAACAVLGWRRMR